MKIMLYKKIFLFPLLFFLVFSLYGIDYDSYGITGGVMYIRNSSNDGAPSPILPFLGVNAGFSINERFFIEPSLVFNFNYYLWSEEEQMALPAEIEYADSVQLLNIILDLPFVMKYKITKDISLGALASPVFIIRIPIRTWGEGDTQKSDILSYFFGGRFLFFEVGALVDWSYSLKHSFKARIDLLLPIYHLWDGDAFSNQLSIRASLTFSFMTKKAQAKRAAAQTAVTTDTAEGADIEDDEENTD